MNKLLEKYPEEIARILAKYPPDRKQSAVMPLLYLAQRESGYVNKHSLDEIAEITGVTATEVGSILGFYSLYHDHPEGKIRIQICTDLACGLRGADEYLANLCAALGIKPGETTPDGLFSVEEVTCLAGCNRAPLFQAQSGDDLSYHEDQTVESTLEWMAGIRKAHAAKTGAEVSR